MTQKQRVFLFGDRGLWHQACIAQGWEYPAEEQRHAIYQELYSGGSIAAIRSRDFSQKDIDVVIARFKAIINPNDIQGQLDQINQNRKRLEHSCMTLARACAQHDWAAYMGTIMCDKFRANALEELTEAQLTMLQHTLAGRAAAKKRKSRKPSMQTAGNPF